MTTEAAKAAKAKYDAKTAKYYSMKLNQNTDRDMIEHLEQQGPFQAYIKRLIREDMYPDKQMNKNDLEHYQRWLAEQQTNTIVNKTAHK